MSPETIPCELAAKSLQGTHFPELEGEWFAWVRRCESRKACLTDEIITKKALSMAASHGLANFKASEHWIRRFKICMPSECEFYKAYSDSAKVDSSI